MAQKIYDCFTFFNELDILEIRLAEMSDVVDRFVLVEATHTFQGNAKPLYFNDNRARFAQWLHKIEHIIVDFPDIFPPTLHKESGWEREEYQRDAIMKGLRACRHLSHMRAQTRFIPAKKLRAVFS
jgi:beta-1,4-mannosyl-glycoprotein beta-1,4-N-acetylglucosaminyltransferase